MSWSMCSSGAAIAKAGANANSTIVNDITTMENWSDETEGYINAETRRDWITNPASGSTSGALIDVASSHIGNKIINYDMSGYSTRLEASIMLDVNADIIRKGITFLKDEAVKENM